MPLCQPRYVKTNFQRTGTIPTIRGFSPAGTEYSVFSQNGKFGPCGSKRNGIGNYNIERVNYTTQSVNPRQVSDFDSLRAIDVQQFGQKVQLSDKTLKELFDVRIPDDTDIEYITEKLRLTRILKAEGMSDERIREEFESNPPLGRQQRTVVVSKNIGHSVISTQDKIATMAREIMDGRAESAVDRVNFTALLSTVLTTVSDIEELTNTEMNNLKEALSRLAVPKNHKDFNLPRIIDIDFYRKNSGVINLLLINNAKKDSINKPIIGIRGNPIEISAAVRYMSENVVGDVDPPRNIKKGYMDLDKLKIIDFADVEEYVSNATGGEGLDSENVSLESLR